MASANSEEIALVAIREEFDVLKAIYEDDVRFCPNNNGNPAATDNANLALPTILQCKISEVDLLPFEIKDGFPHMKPKIKIIGPSPNIVKLEELVDQLLQIL